MDQVVDPANRWMHAVQACRFAGLVGPNEAVPVPPVEFLVAFSPVDKGFSKILASHFDLGVPLVAWCTARGSALFEGCVRRGSHLVIGKRRCLAPAVYVDNFTQIIVAGIYPRHNNCVLLAQEVMTFSLTSHDTSCDDKNVRVRFAIFSSKRVILVYPKLIG